MSAPSCCRYQQLFGAFVVLLSLLTFLKTTSSAVAGVTQHPQQQQQQQLKPANDGNFDDDHVDDNWSADVRSMSVQLASRMRDAIAKRERQQRLMRRTFDNVSAELVAAVDYYARRRHQYDSVDDDNDDTGRQDEQQLQSHVPVDRQSRHVDGERLILQQQGRLTGGAHNNSSQRQQHHQLQNPAALTAGCIPLLIQQNVDGSNFFNRSWADFRVGFSGANGNYWLGNELLHQLTKNGRYKLRFDLLGHNNLWYWAEYATFVVFSESTNYELHVTGYSGSAGFDAMVHVDRSNFTTYDRDNDRVSGNCAVANAGGFWYNNCAHCHVNTMAGKGDNFKWQSLPGGTLKMSRMWLLCR